MTLRRELFSNYSKSQRPATPVKVSLNLVVLNIDHVVSNETEAKTIEISNFRLLTSLC